MKEASDDRDRKALPDEELADGAAMSADMLRSLARRWRFRLQAGRLGRHSATEVAQLIRSLESAARVLDEGFGVERSPDPPVPVTSDAEERFRLLVDAVADHAIYLLDEEGRVVSWNAGAQAIKGYRAEEIIGQPASIFYPEEEIRAGEPKRELDMALREGRWAHEAWRVRKNGERFWAHITITALRWPDGRLRGFAKVTRDLSAHRAAAEALRRSEDRFRLIVESVRDVAIFMLDPSGRIASWNRGAERLKGYTPAEAIGRHFSMFYTDEDRLRNHPAQELEDATKNGSYLEEGWRVRKDGTRFWASVVITAMRDEKGELVGFAKVTRDMTDHRIAEELLRQSEERLRLLVESVRDYAIFMLDPDGKVATWNTGAQHINGYRADEIIGRHFSTFYPPEDVAARRPEEELEQALAMGRYEEEGWRIRKDGTRFWASVIITAVHGGDGRLRGFAKVTRDLTDQRRMQIEAREAEHAAVRERARAVVAQNAVRQRDEFISIAAHELRTPLTALQLKLQGVQLAVKRSTNGTLPAELVATRLESAGRQTNRMAELVERLLDVSRMTSGALVMRFEEVELGALVAQVVDDFRAQAEAAGTDLRFEEGTPVTGHWDRARLEQVVTNLLGNAIKYGESRPVDIVVSATESGARLVVRDHGIGIDSEDADRIFGRFERAAPVGNYGGLGLGLYISRTIVEAHGGAIRVVSAPGKGATFTIDLPRTPPSSSKTPI